ncbi:MAG: hypothetical protein WC309_00280 [Candidatus Paceibacterota bacterium]|jgi:hypothetical protein|nr:hypothetical protein [Candidatus Paceibacterota bacterium]MDD5621040.1 hypothetical protein [Candidatus Paceibacterota bacterium]
MKKYTSKTKISELIKDEKNLKILKKHRVPCVFCPFAPIEMNVLEIGRVAKIYGIDLKKLLEDLNKTS